MLADLSLDNNADDFISYFLKVTDGHTGIRCLVASKDRLGQVIEEVGSNPGLYVLQAEDSTLYVGQSKDLQARLKSHKSTNKIDFCRGMTMVRDQSLAQYLDYGEAKLYVELQKHGFKLEQSSLVSSLAIKEARLLARDKDHVQEANSLLNRFLKYIVALGLSKPSLGEAAPEILVPLVAGLSSFLAEPLIDAEADLPLGELSRQKGPRVQLQVVQSNGVVVPGAIATDIFINALELAGFPLVAELSLFRRGYPLVSPINPQVPGSASHCRAGYRVLTHSSTTDKAKTLAHISMVLGLGWLVTTDGALVGKSQDKGLLAV